MMDRLAEFAINRYRLVLACIGVLLALSLGVLARGGKFSSAAVDILESSIVQQRLGTDLGYPGDSSFLILFDGGELDWDDPRYREELTRVLAPLRADERVRDVLAPDDAPPLVVQRLVSAERHHALAMVTLRDESVDAMAVFPALRASIHSDLLTTGTTGSLAYRRDLDRTVEADVFFGELVSLPLALLVLVSVFRSVFAAALSVGVGALAVLAGVATLTALSHVMEIAIYAINVATLIGLGVAIDYALFLVNRYREEVTAGADTATAVRIAMTTTGHAVLFSGFAVAIGLSGLVFFHGSFLITMGLGGSIVAFYAVAFAFTFLPAMLVALGPRIDAWQVPLPKVFTMDGTWHRIATWVMRRPVPILVAGFAVVATIGLPAVDMRMAASDIQTLPRGVEARDVYERVRELFPDQTRTRILVMLEYPDAPAYTPDRAGEMYEFAERLGALPGVLKVEGAVNTDPALNRYYFEADAETPSEDLPSTAARVRAMSTAGNVALLMVVTDAGPTTEAARDIVRSIRATPTAGEARVLVGGSPAHDVDFGAFIAERTPAAVTFVLGVTLVVLFVMLRSVALPIKAVVMNLLSVAAAFGVLVWVFQEGHFAWLLGFEPRPLEFSLPVVLFCAVFGLSMDYEVLMLSRMREEYIRTGDNTLAVAEGLERTGRLVTSAALIMVTVFAAFSVGRVIMLQAMGVALAVAVALDATLVRVLIVPATMRLFGDVNWWAPRWLGGGTVPRVGRRARRKSQDT
jgi:RND superfamily putative drug exporter